MKNPLDNLSLSQRRRVSKAIASEYRSYKRKLRREPTEAERRQIVAIGFSKAGLTARANPLLQTVIGANPGLRRRRDPFARETYVPVKSDLDCSWCGRRPAYKIVIESDGGRRNELKGAFCSWSCAEAYNDGKIGRNPSGANPGRKLRFKDLKRGDEFIFSDEPPPTSKDRSWEPHIKISPASYRPHGSKYYVARIVTKKRSEAEVERVHRANPSLAASAIGGAVGGIVANALSNPGHIGPSVGRYWVLTDGRGGYIGSDMRFVRDRWYAMRFYTEDEAELLRQRAPSLQDWIVQEVSDIGEAGWHNNPSVSSGVLAALRKYRDCRQTGAVCDLDAIARDSGLSSHETAEFLDRVQALKGWGLNPEYEENPKEAHRQIVSAFLTGRSKQLASLPGRGPRYRTDGQSLWVWGNLVAQKQPGGLWISDAGWRTLLTKNVLNEVLHQTGSGASIFQRDYGWYISGPVFPERPWTGSITLTTFARNPCSNPAHNPLTAREHARVLRSAMSTTRTARGYPPGHRYRAFFGGVAAGKAGIAEDYGPQDFHSGEVAARVRVRAADTGYYGNNPGHRKVTMTLQQFAQKIKATRDKALWRDFLAKIKGYQKWSHGTLPSKVTLEWIEKPGVKGIMISYDAGRAPESTYIMPSGTKRKGAWKHKWDSMPRISHDPEAGLVIQRVGRNQVTDFYRK